MHPLAVSADPGQLRPIGSTLAKPSPGDRRPSPAAPKRHFPSDPLDSPNLSAWPFSKLLITKGILDNGQMHLRPDFAKTVVSAIYPHVRTSPFVFSYLRKINAFLQRRNGAIPTRISL